MPNFTSLIFKGRMDRYIMEELWKPLEEHPGYEVSNMGMIRAISKDGVPTPNLKKYVLGKCAYVRIDTNTNVPIHRMVAKYFVSKDNEYDNEIKFLDGDKLNCVYTNLKWIDRSSLWKEQIASGTRPKPNGYTGVKIKCLETGEEFASIKAVTIATGLPRTTITCAISLRKPIQGKTYVKVE